MTPLWLQHDLKKELETILEHFYLKNARGEKKKLHIFEQELPLLEAMEPVMSDESLDVLEEETGFEQEEMDVDDRLFPHINIKLIDGEIAETSGDMIRVQLIIGVFDNQPERNGHKDVLNIIRKIQERFAKNRVLNKKYVLTYPMRWVLSDEEKYSYYFGGLEMKFETFAIQKEDPHGYC